MTAKSLKRISRLVGFISSIIVLAVFNASHAKPLESKKYKVNDIQFTMVGIEGGSFLMGANNGEKNQRPLHRVNVPSFYAMETEVTFGLWAACVKDGGCPSIDSHRETEQSNLPVMPVRFPDIEKRFIRWINKKTRKKFRLLTEAEWEYAARANSYKNFSWGTKVGSNNANCDGCGSRSNRNGPVSVKSFPANKFGLYDMHGNVAEWVADCLSYSYDKTPSDGSPWKGGYCKQRMVRGGSYLSSPYFIRSAYRFHWQSLDEDWVREPVDIGFRLAYDI